MLEQNPYRRLAVGSITITLFVLLGLLFVVTRNTDEMVAGPLLYNSNAAGGEPLVAAVAVSQQFFAGFTTLVTTAFGALAFLLTMQQRHSRPFSTAALACLSIGLSMLVIALMLSLLGSEILLTMVGNNAINLGLDALKMVRWSMYIAFVAASLFLAWFGLEIVEPGNAHPTNLHSNNVSQAPLDQPQPRDPLGTA